MGKRAVIVKVVSSNVAWAFGFPIRTRLQTKIATTRRRIIHSGLLLTSGPGRRQPFTISKSWPGSWRLAAKMMLEQDGVTAYDVNAQAVTAKMTGWEIEPGQWEMVQSTQAEENGALSGSSRRTVIFERSSSLDVTFPQRTTTVPELKLKEKGVLYWSRPDLGLTRRTWWWRAGG